MKGELTPLRSLHAGTAEGTVRITKASDEDNAGHCCRHQGSRGAGTPVWVVEKGWKRARQPKPAKSRAKRKSV